MQTVFYSRCSSVFLLGVLLFGTQMARADVLTMPGPKAAQIHFERTNGCHWQGTRTHRVCKLACVDGSIRLDLDKRGIRIARVEIISDISCSDKLFFPYNGACERVPRSIFSYFMPDWRRRSRWLAKAITLARENGESSQFLFRGILVKLDYLQPADLDDKFIDVIIRPISR
jgi:hypothetical protein